MIGYFLDENSVWTDVINNNSVFDNGMTRHDHNSNQRKTACPGKARYAEYQSHSYREYKQNNRQEDLDKESFE